MFYPRLFDCISKSRDNIGSGCEWRSSAAAAEGGGGGGGRRERSSSVGQEEEAERMAESHLWKVKQRYYYHIGSGRVAPVAPVAPLSRDHTAAALLSLRG